MLDRILPARVDDGYRGPRLALWLLVPIVLWKIATSLGSIFNGYEAARSADKIPIDAFGPDGAQAVVSLFALLGLAQLVLGAICVVVLVRYRALVPFVYAVLLVEGVARRAILLAKPIVRSGTSFATPVTLGLLALTIVGLVLSLRRAPVAPGGPSSA